MYTLKCYLLRTRFQEFPYIKTLELTSWSKSYFSSDVVSISLYIKRRNKGGRGGSVNFVNTQISAAALIRVAAPSQSFTVNK